jgi:uncharacterized Zn finger protein
MAFHDFYGWAPYVSTAERRRQAARELAKLAKKSGRLPAPVVIEGRKIATTFWGKAWCENLERYSDYATRLPRGRSYVRNGCVVDLQITPGTIVARVSGSELYTVSITVAAVPKRPWHAICRDVAGTIDSVIELLQGRLSTSVMARLCEKGTGLFPTPKEIALSCTCPDWAMLCKHAAAVLYGIGARLDADPALLFTLRQVKQDDLVTRAGQTTDLRKGRSSSRRVLDDAALAVVFGLDLAPKSAPRSAPRPHAPKFTAKATRPARRPVRGRRSSSSAGRPR